MSATVVNVTNNTPTVIRNHNYPCNDKNQWENPLLPSLEKRSRRPLNKINFKAYYRTKLYQIKS